MSQDDCAPERRDFLKALIGAVSTTGFAGASTFLIDGAPARGATAPNDPYKPSYFNDAEWRFINAAVDRLNSIE